MKTGLGILIASFILSAAMASPLEARHFLVECDTEPSRFESHYKIVVEWDELQSAGGPNSFDRVNLVMEIKRNQKAVLNLGPQNGTLNYSNIYRENQAIIGRQVEFSGTHRSLQLKGRLMLLDFADSDYGPSGKNVHGILVIRTNEEAANRLEPTQAQFGVSCAAVSTTLINK